MARMVVQSRRGNVVLAVVGVVYVLAAAVILAAYVGTVGSAAAMVDWALQFALVGAVAFGVWAVLTALANLRVRDSHLWRRS